MGDGLVWASTENLPEEIAEALKLAQAETRNIPESLEDLAQAKSSFTALDRTLDRLLKLAYEAAGLPDDDRLGREACQKEFERLAGEVAALAGRLDYKTPKLSLLTGPQARAAVTALDRLNQVKDQLVKQMREQEVNIIDAIWATLEFIKAMDLAYPRALAGVPDYVKQVALAGLSRSDIQAGLIPGAGIH